MATQKNPKQRQVIRYTIWLPPLENKANHPSHLLPIFSNGAYKDSSPGWSFKIAPNTQMEDAESMSQELTSHVHFLLNQYLSSSSQWMANEVHTST